VGMGEVSASGLPGEIGVLVVQLQSDSPASKMGIRKGDVILRLGNTKTDSAATFLSAYSKVKPARQTTLTVYRNQRPRTVSVTAPSE